MALRRVRIRRCNCLGLDGNLQLPHQSLRANAHPDANTDGDTYTNAYYTHADANTKDYTAATAHSAPPSDSPVRECGHISAVWLSEIAFVSVVLRSRCQPHRKRGSQPV